MISFDDITKLFSFDLEGKWCIEVEFMVKGYPEYINLVGWEKTIKLNFYQ